MDPTGFEPQTVLPFAGSAHDVDDGWSVLLRDDVDGPRQHVLEILWLFDGTKALDAERAGERREVGRWPVQGDADEFVLDVAVAHPRDVLLVALVIAIQAVVVDDGEDGKIQVRQRPQRTRSKQK